MVTHTQTRIAKSFLAHTPMKQILKKHHTNIRMVMKAVEAYQEKHGLTAVRQEAMVTKVKHKAKLSRTALSSASYKLQYTEVHVKNFNTIAELLEAYKKAILSGKPVDVIVPRQETVATIPKRGRGRPKKIRPVPVAMEMPEVEIKP